MNTPFKLGISVKVKKTEFESNDADKKPQSAAAPRGSIDTKKAGE